MPSPRTPTVIAQTFEDLYDQLEDDERAFFDLLDRELDKVQQFYSARESEAVARAAELKDQLTKLGEHRKRYHELYPSGLSGAILPPQQMIKVTKAADKLRLRVPFVHEGDNGQQDTTRTPTNGRPAGLSGASSGDALGEASGPSTGYGSYNPERYQQYKRELRTATLDFYRHLERIKNYRILNLTGFRKALKKFEKATKIHCMDLYTDEKISKESFAKGEVIEKLLDQMEDLFSEHFGESVPDVSAVLIQEQSTGILRKLEICCDAKPTSPPSVQAPRPHEPDLNVFCSTTTASLGLESTLVSGCQQRSSL